MTLMLEESDLLAALDRVEKIETVAATLDGDRRATLRQVVEDTLAHTPPVRPRIAASILGLTEKTVRAWAAEGVLASTTKQPRLLLDAARLHQVLHLVRDLRAAGKQRGLLDEVYRRLADSALLDREDLAESLEQMRRGEGDDFEFRYPASEAPSTRASA
ncbi:hypothetical protein [Modestobacter sp. KNN46-3]|uniref:hypothetical protein n=1 Tax=Modestobacter sp. KNN46-3 TaxID=2711218 RepID=UPI0013DED853|nr:hypothetical protein [Modestobacter sp. KNN46-3]